MNYIRMCHYIFNSSILWLIQQIFWLIYCKISSQNKSLTFSLNMNFPVIGQWCHISVLAVNLKDYWKDFTSKCQFIRWANIKLKNTTSLIQNGNKIPTAFSIFIQMSLKMLCQSQLDHANQNIVIGLVGYSDWTKHTYG